MYSVEKLDELREFLQECGKIHFPDLLPHCHNAGFKVFGFQEQQELLLLYGQRVRRPGDEMLVGSLRAIGPGLILFIPEAAAPVAQGLVYRHGDGYQVRSLIASRYDSWVEIDSTTENKTGTYYTGCTALIRLEYGSGGVTLGIPAERWEKVRTWLDQWLQE